MIKFAVNYDLLDSFDHWKSHENAKLLWTEIISKLIKTNYLKLTHRMIFPFNWRPRNTVIAIAKNLNTQLLVFLYLIKNKEMMRKQCFRFRHSTRFLYKFVISCSLIYTPSFTFTVHSFNLNCHFRLEHCSSPNGIAFLSPFLNWLQMDWRWTQKGRVKYSERDKALKHFIVWADVVQVKLFYAVGQGRKHYDFQLNANRGAISWRTFPLCLYCSFVHFLALSSADGNKSDACRRKVKSNINCCGRARELVHIELA